MRNWKNFILFLILIPVLDCNTKNSKVNSENGEWISIFNGQNLDGWMVKINGYPLGKNINNTFSVQDGVLKVSYDGYEKFGNSYGHIFYNKPLSNYKLRLQYRFVGDQMADGAGWAEKNSGVMLHSQSPESMLIDQEFPVSLEAQFLGGVQEGVDRPTANLCTPGTHVTIGNNEITDHCLSSTSNTYHNEEWIPVEFHVFNDSLVRHLVKGKEVFRYTKPIMGGEYLPDTEEWKVKEGKALKEGYIALQSESHPVEFRNIEVLEIKDY